MSTPLLATSRKSGSTPFRFPLIPPFIFLGDFNINLNPDHPTSSPRVLKFLDWVTSQDLCIMNLDIPTQTGSCGQSSLLDLTILSRTVYNKIKFYVHSDQFDSDHHPIILFSPSSVSSVPSNRTVRWRSAADALNKISDIIAPSYHSFIQICTQKITDSAHRSSDSNRPRCPWWDHKCTVGKKSIRALEIVLAIFLCFECQFLSFYACYKEYKA